MNNRNFFSVGAVVLIVAIVFSALVVILRSKVIASVDSSVDAIGTSATTKTIITADWVSDATTPEELLLESDLVVMVRADSMSVTRVVRHELPVWDENNNIVGSTVSETLFSDTAFEVLRIYQGDAPPVITVMQTGGFDPIVSPNIFEVIDDPLYKIGEEYILFLVDISGDPVQGLDRQLYRIVNPFGRYKIEDGIAISYGQDPSLVRDNTQIKVIELEERIKTAIQETNK